VTREAAACARGKLDLLPPLSWLRVVVHQEKKRALAFLLHHFAEAQSCFALSAWFSFSLSACALY
jgi:hypothetical protein